MCLLAWLYIWVCGTDLLNLERETAIQDDVFPLLLWIPVRQSPVNVFACVVVDTGVWY
jgi:hypothetical protein